ncbi:hypothetical protein J6590_034275 [Homalodisca vitripennis]|nr:hypothetical protein J6590_034275 [Homalodisca vitripennis]
MGESYNRSNRIKIAICSFWRLSLLLHLGRFSLDKNWLGPDLFQAKIQRKSHKTGNTGSGRLQDKIFTPKLSLLRIRNIEFYCCVDVTHFYSDCDTNTWLAILAQGGYKTKYSLPNSHYYVSGTSSSTVVSMFPINDLLMTHLYSYCDTNTWLVILAQGGYKATYSLPNSQERIRNIEFYCCVDVPKKKCIFTSEFKYNGSSLARYLFELSGLHVETHFNIYVTETLLASKVGSKSHQRIGFQLYSIIRYFISRQLILDRQRYTTVICGYPLITADPILAINYPPTRLLVVVIQLVSPIIL